MLPCWEAAVARLGFQTDDVSTHAIAILIAWYRPGGPKWTKKRPKNGFWPHRKKGKNGPKTGVENGHSPILRPFFPFPGGTRIYFSQIEIYPVQNWSPEMP